MFNDGYNWTISFHTECSLCYMTCYSNWLTPIQMPFMKTLSIGGVGGASHASGHCVRRDWGLDHDPWLLFSQANVLSRVKMANNFV